jgi:hypothetical protein
MFAIAVTAGNNPTGLRLRRHFCAGLLLLAPVLLDAAELKPETLRAWDAYVRAAQMRTEVRARGQRSLIKPLAERIPRNILLATLQDTRDAVKQESSADPPKLKPLTH